MRAIFSRAASIAEPIATQISARLKTGVSAHDAAAAFAAATAREAVSTPDLGNCAITSPVAGLTAGIVSGSVCHLPPMKLAGVLLVV
jgi:hypothetical protein